MSTPPNLEQWCSVMAEMVLFHQEQGLPWLWLHTPTQWIEDLQAKDTLEQASLRKLQVLPSTPPPQGLSWYAWDTRSDAWIQDELLMASWYKLWLEFQPSQTHD